MPMPYHANTLWFPEEVQDLCLGTTIPALLQRAAQSEQVTQVNQMTLFPCHSVRHMSAQQKADQTIQELLVFWRQRSPLSSEERKALSRQSMVLLRQWDCLVEVQGVLYHQVFLPDGGEEVLQVLLPVAMKQEVLTQLHQQHGHEGVECTRQLVRQRCYCPGMSQDIARWCQECERCQCAKDTQPTPGTFMGHLLATRPNEILVDFTVGVLPLWS